MALMIDGRVPDGNPAARPTPTMSSPPAVVSVIMPFRDVAAYLAEAVESVRAQTYPHWELLLVDDGSADGGTEIARGYAARDPARVRWLEHEGHESRGASASRNLGIRHAAGDYVALLDGDDVWLPRKLEEQLALLARHPEADVLYGATEYWHSWTGRAEDAGRDVVVRSGFPAGAVVRPPEVLARTLAGEAAVPCTCSLIARRAAVDRAGGFEEAFRRVYTDQAFYAKLFLTATALVSDACWDRYRRHPASSCATADREGVLRAEWLRYLDWLTEHLRGRGLYGGRLAAAVRVGRLRARHPWLGRAYVRGRRLVGRVAGGRPAAG
jgi:glycosyltransferase involved in cell wall biosynthesis